MELTTQKAPAAPMSELARNGEHAVKTGMLPDHIKTGWQFAVIAATGSEMGMQPMRAIRSLVMVKGRVVEDAASQLARFKSAGGKAEFEKLDETTAVLRLVHPNGDKHLETFTIEDAKRAGLANSPMYSKFPKAMLRSRAITAALKSIGWEGAVGTYDPMELQEVDDIPPQPPAPKPAPELKPRTPSSSTLRDQALNAVNKADTADELNRIRDKVEKHLSAGHMTPADADEVFGEANHRQDVLDPT